MADIPADLLAVAKKKLPEVKFDTARKIKVKGEDAFEIRGKQPNGKVREVEVSAGGEHDRGRIIAACDPTVGLCPQPLACSLTSSMLTAVRQYLVVLAIALWLGGFTFYAAVVVPTGAEVLGGSVEQGFVTRARHAAFELRSRSPRCWFCCGMSSPSAASCWPPPGWAMLLAQLALFAFHRRLDAMLDPATHDIADDFHFLHEVYLWIAAIQWGLGLAHVWCVLAGSAQATATGFRGENLGF